jgi:hypothetical protein
MSDRDVVDAFVAHLATNRFPGLKVDRRPDDENRDSPEIDAMAGSFAIEHTSVDTLPNQRRDSDWFMPAAGGLEKEIEAKPAFRLRITLEYDAVGKGQDWESARTALKTWVANEAPNLPEGTSVVEMPTNIPFRLHVEKSSERRPGLFFARFEPGDDTLAARVKAAFDRKAAKLGLYQCPG